MATTNWSKVDRLELRLRVGVATRLMDRVSYDAIRAWLAAEGVAADDLPADRTMRDYLKGSEARAWTMQRAGDYLRSAPGDALTTLEERVSTANQARAICMGLEDLQDRLNCSGALRARLAMVRGHVDDAEYQLDELRERGIAPDAPAYQEAAEGLAYWTTRLERLLADPDRLSTGMTLRVVSQTLRLIDRAVALSKQEREAAEGAEEAAKATPTAPANPRPNPMATAMAMMAGPMAPQRPAPASAQRPPAAAAPTAARPVAPAEAPAVGQAPASAPAPAEAPRPTPSAADGGIRQDSVGIRQGSAVAAPSPGPVAPPETADTQDTPPAPSLNRAQRRAMKRRRDKTRC